MATFISRPLTQYQFGEPTSVALMYVTVEIGERPSVYPSPHLFLASASIHLLNFIGWSQIRATR